MENLELHSKWFLGSYLIGTDQEVPENGFRVARNTRVDRSVGAISSRPGLSQLTSGQIDASYATSLYVSKLFGTSADYHYIQVSNGSGSRLYRMNSSWAGSSLLSTDASTQGYFDANWIDGKGGIWKYLTNGTTIGKDNGTSSQSFGIAAPTQPPASVTLGTRDRIAIYAFEDVAQLTIAGNAVAASTDTSFFQEGSASVQVPVSGGEVVTAGLGFAGARAWHNGAHDGGNNSASLVDSSEDFVTAGITRGSRVRNTTDGCEGVITRVTATELFFDGGLSGGAQNDFDTGDNYEIYFNLATFGNTFASGTDNSGENNKTTSTTVSSATFKTNGVMPGMTIWNTSNGTKATITSVTETTLTFAGGCSGATENDFDNGDTFIVVNDLVADDDYIHLWVRTTFPKNANFMQLDFELDTATYASAFTNDYYTIRLPMTVWFTQGDNDWTELFIRKSEFTRIGTSSADWSAVRAMRIIMDEGEIDSCSFFFDDLSLVGGYGLEGEYQYIAVYSNSTTGCRSAPPTYETDSNVYELMPTPVVKKFKRHPAVVDLSNIDNPSDTQISHIRLYRKGGNLLNWTLVRVLPDNTASFTDTFADSMIALNEVLETDNNPPPSTLKTLMGPGALNRLFGIYSRNRLAFSKSWQENESRGENWPPLFYVTIGDGSSEALNGAVQDTNIFVWTEDQTYMVVGQSGTDVFIPVPLPQSRGLASRYGVTVGANQVFFLAKDGIYSQKGSMQRKLTSAIDPFFLGTEVDDIEPLSHDLIGECRLVYFPNPQGDEVVMTYSSDGITMDKRLVLKRNPQTGEFTEAFFDDTTGITGRALYVDLTNNHLIWGSDASRIYRLEINSADTDDGTNIEFRARTSGFTSGLPVQQKDYKDFIFEANSLGTNITVTAYYNKGNTTETITTTYAPNAGDSSRGYQPTEASTDNPDVQTRFYSVGIEFTSSTDTQIKIFKVGFDYLLRPHDRNFLDTGELAMPTKSRLWKINVDWESTGSSTWRLYLDGETTASDSGTLSATGAQRGMRNVVVIEFPGDLHRAKVFRLTITSNDTTATQQIYGIQGWFRPEPEDVTWWDSDHITFDHVHAMKRLDFDIDAPESCTVTVMRNGSTFGSYTLSATSGRQRVNLDVPAGIKGTDLQVQIQSDTVFQVWGLVARLKSWGNPSGYGEKTLQTLDGTVVDKNFLAA